MHPKSPMLILDSALVVNIGASRITTVFFVAVPYFKHGILYYIPTTLFLRPLYHSYTTAIVYYLVSRNPMLIKAPLLHSPSEATWPEALK